MSLDRHEYRGAPTMYRILRRLVVEESGCLTYIGKPSPDGYAVAWVEGRSQRLHRWMYEQIVGPIPADMTIDHLCQTKLCVNVAHLEPVSAIENVKRAAARRQVCPNGHPYAPTDTSRSSGERCRTCVRERQARWRARNPKNTRQRSKAA